MKLEDVFGLMIPATFLVMLLIEKQVNARSFPKLRFWNLIGVVFLLIMGALSAVIPSLLPGEWLAAHRLLSGAQLPLAAQVALGWLTLSFVAYLWHRNVHRVGFLWRTFHQIHHAPERLDIPGSVLFHPLEVVVQVSLAVAVTTFVLGLDPLAAAIVGYIQAFYGMFQHWNVRTPRGLGYLIQRPEAHGVHHQKGVHAFNYADFPLWDILAGTFRNPESFEAEVGFPAEISQRYGRMLAFRDVNREIGATEVTA